MQATGRKYIPIFRELSGNSIGFSPIYPYNQSLQEESAINQDVEPSDQELMQSVARNDREAFRILVERHQQKMLNFFVRMGVYTDQEDLVQQTFIRLYRNRAGYRPRAKFTTYLYTIARSVRIDRIRKEQRRGRMQAAYTEAQALAAQGGYASDRKGAVREAVQALPEKLRICLVLSVYQGLKYIEIAEVLEIPEGTVKSRMHQAMKHLKKGLRETNE